MSTDEYKVQGEPLALSLFQESVLSAAIQPEEEAAALSAHIWMTCVALGSLKHHFFPPPFAAEGGLTCGRELMKRPDHSGGYPALQLLC